MTNRIEFIKCPTCGHNQKQDKAHPQTFHCSECGKHFNYRVNVKGSYEIITKGRKPLPQEMRKATVSGVRAYPYDVARAKKRGYTQQQVYDAGLKFLLDSVGEA